MRNPQDYRACKVVILGLAKSGVAAAELFHRLGAEVVVNDRKPREECPEAAQLEALQITVICGEHPADLIDERTALIVKNPGIPYHATPLRTAEKFGIEVVTEVEVASMFCAAPMIGITGSNGKTTTTTLVGRILEEAGLSPIVAGNIGKPLCTAALEAKATDWMVVELSSFQLKGTQKFRPRIGCLLNVYETHLDYHGSMEDYIASKAKLFANQGKGDTAVLNADDPVCQSMLPKISADVLLFSLRQKLEYGVYLDAETEILVYADKDGVIHTILPSSQLGIRGSHNIENALAAAAISIAAGAALDHISSVLRSFKGVEHRLEWVREFEGITFYNDSKATNPVATMKSIEAFDGGIVLIAGGLDRGSDYLEMLPMFEENVKGLVTIGQTRGTIEGVAKRAGLSCVKTVDTVDNAADAVEQAVRAALAMAKHGDIVLLSPACASWDMFPSYEVRGSMFKKSVHNL